MEKTPRKIKGTGEGKGMATGGHLSGTEMCPRRAINTRKKLKGLLALQNQDGALLHKKLFKNQTLLY